MDVKHIKKHKKVLNMNKKELLKIIEKEDDYANIYIDCENSSIVFVADGREEHLFIDAPKYCHECESNGLVDVDPEHFCHETDGFWVNQHGARFFMAYCDCDAGMRKNEQREHH